MKFKTQAEIFQALLDGACISHISWASGYVFLKDGYLVDCRGNHFNISLTSPSEWVKFEKPTPPKKLYAGLFYDRSLGVYRIVDALFDSEATARKFSLEAKEEFIKFVHEYEIK